MAKESIQAPVFAVATLQACRHERAGEGGGGMEMKRGEGEGRGRDGRGKSEQNKLNIVMGECEIPSVLACSPFSFAVP